MDYTHPSDLAKAIANEFNAEFDFHPFQKTYSVSMDGFCLNIFKVYQEFIWELYIKKGANPIVFKDKTLQPNHTSEFFIKLIKENMIEKLSGTVEIKDIDSGLDKEITVCIKDGEMSITVDSSTEAINLAELLGEGYDPQTIEITKKVHVSLEVTANKKESFQKIFIL